LESVVVEETVALRVVFAHGVLLSANEAHAVTASAFHFVASGNFLDALPASRAYYDFLFFHELCEFIFFFFKINF